MVGRSTEQVWPTRDQGVGTFKDPYQPTRPHEVIAQLCGTGPGLAHARTYAATHGHLATPQTACPEGFALGRWLSEQRHQAQKHHRSAGGTWPLSTLLAALDPWWNPPWSLEWQRNWSRVRERSASAADDDGGSTGMTGLEKELAGWLRRQCTGYATLHPEQHRLLAKIGITAETARAALPPAPRTEPGLLDTSLAQAHAYAAEYGHIAAPVSTVLDGFPLGKWLAWQRQRARQGRLSPTRTEALTMIDPWWNPPWPLQWQQAYHRLRTSVTGAAGVPATSLPRDLCRWIRVQQESWEHLHPGQQDLLAALGITRPTGGCARGCPNSSPGTRTAPACSPTAPQARPPVETARNGRGGSWRRRAHAWAGRTGASSHLQRWWRRKPSWRGAQAAGRGLGYGAGTTRCAGWASGWTGTGWGL
ncbi:helicase associated domain-containing protein [Streptomyces sp. NPDC002643]